MAETKWTKGPWHRETEDSSMVTLVGPDGAHVMTTTICNNCSLGNDVWKWGRCYSAKPEDAALIAAAPALYEALQAVIAWWGLNPDHKAPGIPISKVRAALSTARGEKTNV